MFDLAKSGDPIPDLDNLKIIPDMKETFPYENDFYPGSNRKIPFMLVGYDGELNKKEANIKIKHDHYET